MTSVRSGRTDSLTDVAGIRVGHHARTDAGWLSGTTVVRLPSQGAVTAVDVRGGAPGSRETDVLEPGALVERVHAIVLTGGSAYGLAAASGVADALGEAGVGFRLGPDPSHVVPIVPAAVILDLGRGGDFAKRPGPAEGRAALAAASSGPVAQGCVGAGAGARAGGLKGAVGSASQLVPRSGEPPRTAAGDAPVGWTVAALVVVNAAGSPVAPDGSLYAAAYATSEPLASAPRVDRQAYLELLAATVPAAANTTIGVVATDATLTKAQCRRLAMAAQNGIARGVRPSHLLVDGDLLFAVSSEQAPAPDGRAINDLFAAAADCVERAIGHAMLAATTMGGMTSFRDLARDHPAAASGSPQTT